MCLLKGWRIIMKNLNFLNKLKKTKSLQLVECSEEISKSYLIKSENCIKVAKLAFESGICENAVTESYYSVYNTVLSLLYKCGIKCENHSGAVILIKELFGLEELYEIFSEFKKDRIDNQYYVSTRSSESITKEKCAEKIKTAQMFSLDLRAFMNDLTFEKINKIRDNLMNMLDRK
jgi:uncharacterized protein (UPF0332 family)